MQAEHTCAHDLRTDLGEVLVGILVVDTGGALTGRVVQHAGPERAGRD